MLKRDMERLGTSWLGILAHRLAETFGLLVLSALAVQAEPPRLGKGLNMDIWVEWHHVGAYLADPSLRSPYPDWPRHVSDDRLAQLRAEGFDFIRLPIDPEPLLLLDPGALRNGLLAEIRARVEQLHAAGFTVIVDLHTFPRDEAGGIDRIMNNQGTWQHYVDLVGAVGLAIADFDPARTLFEPINEPTNDCPAIWEGKGKQAWPAMLAQLHKTAREAAPDLTLVLSGACWGGIEGLMALDPAAIADVNVIWTFHSYTPFAFTHQGASWAEGPVAFLTDLPYPPSHLRADSVDDLADLAATRAKGSTRWFAKDFTPEDFRAEIKAYRALPDDAALSDIRRAADWAQAHDIPTSRLLLGEFGAIGGSETGGNVRPADRWRFLADKSRAAEDLGIGWAVWSWTADFGIAEGRNRRLIPAACGALRLRRCTGP